MILFLNKMKKSLNTLFAFAFLLPVFLFPIFFAFAQPSGTMDGPGDGTGGVMDPPGLVKLENPFSRGNNLYDFLKAIVVDIMLPLGGVLVVIAIIYTGFLFVTAQGNEEKLKTAKKALTYTVIGSAILLGAWTIALVIENTIGAITTP